MKVSRKGQLKLGRDDLRLGNFVVTLESGHVKFQDIGGVISHRVSLYTPKGQIMKMLWGDARKGDKDAERHLSDYCAVMYNVLGCVPFVRRPEDGSEPFVYLKEINDLTVRVVELNKGLYGIVDDVDKAEDDRVLREEVEYAEAVEDARKDLGL